jgi:AhpD family alkylhydroperoxidase
MKPDNKEDIDVESIMQSIEDYFGFVPKIFQVLAMNPLVLEAYYNKFKVLMNDRSLNPLTKEYISIGAASALGAEHCLSTHLKVARELGATDKELHLAIILGSLIAETDALAKSLRVFEDFKH